MVNIEELKAKLAAYTDEVKLFFHAYGLGKLLLDKPMDHVAVKGKDRAEYEQYIDHYLPLSKRLTSEQVNNRDLGTAELYEPIEAGSFGAVDMVEIMEPRPGAEVTTHEMIDHFELLVESLDDIKAQLDHVGIKYEVQANDAHTAVVVVINKNGQEIKFTDRSLRDIVNTHIAGRTTITHK